MTKHMSTGDWTFVKNLAREKGVTLREAGIKQSMPLGQAIDWVLDAAGE